MALNQQGNQGLASDRTGGNVSIPVQLRTQVPQNIIKQQALPVLPQQQQVTVSQQTVQQQAVQQAPQPAQPQEINQDMAPESGQSQAYSQTTAFDDRLDDQGQYDDTGYDQNVTNSADYNSYDKAKGLSGSGIDKNSFVIIIAAGAISLILYLIIRSI